MWPIKKYYYYDGHECCNGITYVYYIVIIFLVLIKSEEYPNSDRATRLVKLIILFYESTIGILSSKGEIVYCGRIKNKTGKKKKTWTEEL
jgi:hypothetical protein